MQHAIAHRHRWGVILAGGNGERLRPLTRRLSGDERPKQFCELLGGQTLLAQTRHRVRRLVSPEQTLLVLTEAHKGYYERELARDVAAWTIEQPFNRGTAPAILWSLLRVAELDWDAVVAFFPSDHYFARKNRFRAGVARAFATAEEHRNSVIVVGSEPNCAETGYGWIEAEDGQADASRVVSFFEKPAIDEARRLYRMGCQWNTFIMVGTLHAFLEMVADALPELFQEFHRAARQKRIRDLYEELSPTDFSRQVLAHNTSHLLTTTLGDAGWSDLGEPSRALSVMERRDDRRRRTAFRPAFQRDSLFVALEEHHAAAETALCPAN